jgi:hypothetical protein
MTCHEVRGELSALLDDALPVAERRALEAHLAACADCRRELDQLRATVAHLSRLPAARAPAGFVDRVMAEAYRPSWPRRLLDALFVPLRVKLPIEAAAVLLVGVSALYVYQRTPEVQQLARQEAPQSSRAPAVAPPAPSSGTVSTPPAPTPAPGPPPSKDRAREVERALSKEGAASEAKQNQDTVRAAGEEPRQTPPAIGQRPPSVPQAPSAPAAQPPAAQPPAAQSNDARGAFTAKKEALVEQRSDALSKTAPPTGSERVAQPAEPSAARDAAGAGPAPSAAAPTTPPPAAPPPETPGRVGGVASAPSEPPATEGAPAPVPSAAKSRLGARLMRAVDASGRLTVPARAPAERALDALLARVGAARVGRLLEGDRGMIVIDVLVPAARYRELIEGLGQIGRWVTEYESGILPAQVRVEVALTVEP